MLEIVRRHDAFLIEDDWALDLGINAAPRPPVGYDDAGSVIYPRSLTTVVSPTLRWPLSSLVRPLEIAS